jgi:hypothetical protein
MGWGVGRERENNNENVLCVCVRKENNNKNVLCVCVHSYDVYVHVCGRERASVNVCVKGIGAPPPRVSPLPIPGT